MDDLEAPALRFELLGPLRVRRGDSVVHLGSAQRQAILATLALRAGQPVSRDRMLAAVWGDEPPAYAINLLQKHISALRRSLRPDQILTWTDRGYVLALPPGSRDIDTFERAAETGRRAREAGDPAGAANSFRAALDCWRGPLCDGLPGPYLEAERYRHEELRLAIAADRAEVELDLPGRADVTGELRRLVAEHPAHERLRGLLMLALHRSGRRSAALAEFRELTRLLRDEYGVEPAASVQRLHRRMLDADPALDPPPARPRTPTALQQLPPRLPDFVDREDEVARLGQLLDERATVLVIAGTAGVGKTSLAVHWAHEVRARFPDGQLYANLRGFDPDGAEAAPGEVIRGFLAAFAVPAHAVPDGLAEQTALLRSLVADRRILVLLDNARSSEQVRPLLPGASGCLTVVTSRNDLTGLVVAEGARPVTLDLPGYAAARQLLRSRLGADRVGAEAAAVTTLITACARLPLALAVVAARAVTRPGLALATVAEEVREGLDALRGSEDRGTDVRAAFDWSYQQLSASGARMFRLLGAQPGPGFTVAAAASAAAEPVPVTRRILAELAGAHLVGERSGRYEMHDLLRAYAIARGGEQDAPAERSAASSRLLDHYLHTAHRADVLIKPHRDDRVEPPPPAAGVSVGEFTGRDAAAAWLAAERPVLLALVRRAGADPAAVRLAWTMVPFLDHAGRWQDKVDVLGAALAAAERVGDPGLRAETHRMLGSAYVRLGRFPEAHAELDAALAGYPGKAGAGGRARVHRTAAWALERQQRHREALDRARLALAEHRVAGNRVGEGRALNAVGWFHARLGDHRRALARCAAALDRQRRIGDRFGEAETLDSLGYIQRHLGAYAEAVASYRWAARLYRDFGDRFNEADTVRSLGDTCRDAGWWDEARSAWRDALAIFEALDHEDVASVRTRLAAAP